MKPNLKGLDKRLSDLETCLLTMTNLRLYLCKAESKFGRCRYLHPEFNEYKEECFSQLFICSDRTLHEVKR